MHRELMLQLLLAGHLMCMNVAAAGPWVCLVCEWRESRGDQTAGRAGRDLALLSLLLFAIGILPGLLLGWMLWHQGLAETLNRLPSRAVFGLWELLFSVLLMVTHLVWWHRVPCPARWVRRLRCLLPLLAGANSLYHFPLLLVVIAQVTHGQLVLRGSLDAQFRDLLVHGAVVSRAVHFVLAAVAASGLALAWCSQRCQPAGAGDKLVVAGGRLALGATVFQIPVGLWVLFELPSHSWTRLMGHDVAGSLFLVLSLLASVWLLHKLAAMALRDTSRRTLHQAMWAMAVVIVLMTGVLRRLSPSRRTTHAASAALRVPPTVSERPSWISRER
ncbi:MAG: hypothetical protein CMJ59_00440 [Planctomycetaceae bacterium]|nr:hypothetical protein [Planctomycetaceae bacterium]